MGFFRDLLPAFKKHKIVLVEKRQEIGNIITFVFKSEEKIHWKAGQHGILTFGRPKLEGGSWRGFSIASHPDDGIILISTRVPDKPSAFKSALAGLKPGDAITMRGPFGPFYIEASPKSVVFIAGGIGITPYRSLVLDFIKNRDGAPENVNLLYIDDKGEYAYKDEFDKISSENGFLKVNYIVKREELTERIKEFSGKYRNEALYFISGSQGMVKAVKNLLKEQGIGAKNIKNEIFIGYK